MIDARLTAAVAVGKLAGLLSRRLRLGGGTTFPGTLANRIDARLLPKLATGLPIGSLIVTGTNGKTTTTRLIANIFRANGWHPVHNRTGANLLNGLATALVDHYAVRSAARLSRPGPAAKPTLRDATTFAPTADVGLFEVDEAVLPAAIALIRPRAVMITNLFRDQLDRYGELDYLARIWRDALVQLPPDAWVLLNADDPLVARLGLDLPVRVLYYGLDDRSQAIDVLDHAADSKTCPVCGSPLAYEAIYYGHLGVYHCPDHHITRPAPDVAAVSVQNGAPENGAHLKLRIPGGDLAVHLPLPGLYNAYNALAAISAALAFEVDLAAIQRGVESFSAAFGRVEQIPVDGRTVFLALVKNPVGFNQVLRTVFHHGESGASARSAVILINDNFADGTDISWLWDVDFERLAGQVDWVICGGTRGEDMGVRLKYAGVEPERLRLVSDVAAALDAGLAATPPGATLYVLPSYTAMLEARAIIARRAGVGGFWEN